MGLRVGQSKQTYKGGVGRVCDVRHIDSRVLEASREYNLGSRVPGTHPRIPHSHSPVDQRTASTYLVLGAALHALESRYSVGRSHVLGHGLVVGVWAGGCGASCVVCCGVAVGGVGESCAADDRVRVSSSMSHGKRATGHPTSSIHQRWI